MTYVSTPALAPSSDPIHAAINRHRAAWAAVLIASEGMPAVAAHDDYDAATDAMVATACTTRFGALALLAHLLLWIEGEAEFAAGHQPAYRLAQARAADLTLFLGTNLPLVATGATAPAGRTVGPLPRHFHSASGGVRANMLFTRAQRVLAAGAELVSALVIIIAGVVFTGFASIL